jgi:hypothetical protein
VKHLMIRDLAMTQELGCKAMAGLRGGIALLEPAPVPAVPLVPFDWRHIRIDELLGLKPTIPLAQITLPQNA